MNTELEQIPVLGDDNTELQVCSYLKWLWRSPFRYHLDDDLKNIVWSGLDKHPSDEILDRLATNLERAYQFAGATYPNDKDWVWDRYALTLDPSTFSLGDKPDCMILSGYHDPTVFWNGWNCPYFTKSSADEIVEYIADPAILRYDEDNDVYVYYNESTDERDYYEPTEIIAPDGIRKVYPIGSWFWTWEEVRPWEKAELARRVSIENQQR